MKRAKAAGALDALARLGIDPAKAPHLFELAGLGALAVPVAHHFAKPEDRNDRALAGIELGGLGLLAAPTLSKMVRR